ncbi:hypothetical protein FDP41_001294 [Naegleria fowleri]|uniref:Uncharacterized protein n=1 Tax=Naegleria fowleri TaxID=5763 RepID=A0A6A5BWD7_NAEFO|nr:uncharacterized protein FDP41_001294 [Naegleria fowleri]KAF0979626.1 hypothetical protein FDP41_001294 [Naegleria fowleri]
MTSLDFAASNHLATGSNGLSSFDFDSSTPIHSVSNHIFDSSSSTSTHPPSSSTTTGVVASSTSTATTTTFEDTLYSPISEKEGNKYYKGFKRTHKSQNGQVLREQMFWIGDFIQFSIVSNPNEPPNVHEGRILSIYTCTLFPNIKKCKVQMLHTQPQLKGELGLLGMDSLPKENSARRFMTNSEGEIFLHTIIGRVFVVRDAKELKERCGFYVKDDPHVNTLDQDCYSMTRLFNSNPNSNSTSILNPNTHSNPNNSNNSSSSNVVQLRPQISISDSTPHLTFSWTMKDFKTSSTSLYNYYTSCVIRGESHTTPNNTHSSGGGGGSCHGMVLLSVGNVCTLEVRSSCATTTTTATPPFMNQSSSLTSMLPSSQTTSATTSATTSTTTPSIHPVKILMGRISKMFEEKSNTFAKYFAIEEIQVNSSSSSSGGSSNNGSNRKVSMMSYTGCVKTVSIHDILSVKKQLL